MKPILSLVPILAILCTLSCTKEIIKQTVTPVKGHDITTIEKKDTLGYVVSFSDSQERSHFITSFNKMIKQYRFQKDSGAAAHYFYLKSPVVPPAPAPVIIQKTDTVFVQTPSVPSMESTTMLEPVPKPKSGGSATLYFQREFADETVLRLICDNPLSGSCDNASSQGIGLLDAKAVSDRQIDITINPSFTTSSGKSVLSLDIINAWTTDCKKYPAKGRSLFRSVKGIEGFIAGREATVSGFIATDDKNISIKLANADPQALDRLCTSTLLPRQYCSGPYVVKSETPGSFQLIKNNRYTGKITPYLESCVVKLGKDPNPILAFSMGRYDAMTIYSLKDIDYAKRKLLDKADLLPLAQNRYFCVCATPAADARKAIAKCIDGKDILANFVKAEGAALSCIETDSSAVTQQTELQPEQGTTAPSMASILYRSDDPVSVLIAQKLLADLSRAKLTVSLRPCLQEAFEQSLVRKDFDIAIGFTSHTVTTDANQRSRFCAMWFGDASPEAGRIADFREIPLFSVQEYLLCKKKFALYGGSIEGIFIKE